MKFKYFLLSALLFPFSGLASVDGVHHYHLDFDSESSKLTAYACGDNACSPDAYYQSEVKKLHIKDGINNNEISNFKSFYKKGVDSSPNIKSDKKGCMQFTIQNADKNNNGAVPWPKTDPALRCFVDGDEVSNCRVCSNENQSATLAGYVYGSVELDENTLGFSPAAYGLSIKKLTGDGVLRDAVNGNILKKGDTVYLPLTLSYDKAEKIELELKGDNGKSGKKKQEVEYQLELVYVPKELKWVTTAECTNNGDFNYEQHASNCDVLGKAGNNIQLILQTYGTADRKIEDYNVQLTNIEIRELNAFSDLQASFVQDEINFNQAVPEINTSQNITNVSLVEAFIPEHCAPYAAEESRCLLTTQGDTTIVGRTVPASLRVREDIAGDITGDVVYVEQPDSVQYNKTPGFIVEGFDTKGNALPSYSGEFAGGLKTNIQVELDTTLPHSDLVLTYSEPATGQHLIELDLGSLLFIKDKPFAQTSLNLPLKMTIEDHDKTLGVDGKTTLADKEDMLRFGFLTLEDLELPIELAGNMPIHLNYYSNNINTVAEDGGSSYILPSSTSINVTTMPIPPLSLTVVDQAIEVSAYEQPWSGKVELEVPRWIQPYNNGGLIAPSALLDITNRKRGNDRVFNRREVSR